MIFKRFSLTFSLFFATCLTFFIATESSAQRVNKGQRMVATKIKLEGNVILDDRSLAKSSALGNGVQMNGLMRELLIAETEGYYSSHGFHLVKANFPRKKPKNGTLTLFLDEREEIKKGDSERERAEEALTRLVSYRNLEIPDLNRQETIKKLMQGYKTKRITDAEIERKRIESQKAKIMIELEKRAAAEEARNKIKQKEWSLIMERMKNYLEDPESQLPLVPWEKDFQKAQIAVDRLIENNQLEISSEMRRLAITKLINRYRNKRQERLMALKNLRSKSQKNKTGINKKIKMDLIDSELSNLKQSLTDSNSKLNSVPWEEDYQRAQASVKRLIKNNQLNVSPEMRRQAIAKLIATYRTKRLEETFELENLDSEPLLPTVKPNKDKAMDLDNSEISKMRQRMKTIMAGQNFSNPSIKKDQKMKERLIEIQSKQNFDL